MSLAMVVTESETWEKYILEQLGWNMCAHTSPDLRIAFLPNS